jgi:hypothetical protein
MLAFAWSLVDDSSGGDMVTQHKQINWQKKAVMPDWNGDALIVNASTLHNTAIVT